MERWDAVRLIFPYRDKSGSEEKAGVILWKGRNIVYSLMNERTTSTMDSCMYRELGGLVEIKRPTVISKYNMFMDGVDVTHI